MTRLLIILMLLGGSIAHGDNEPERPWAKGVPAASQARALELFRAGNDAFGQSEYAEAVTRYRAALAVWDHPAIHGNLAVALIQLDQPVDAYEHLQQALRYGAAPFEPTAYQQLLTDQKLIAGQLGQVEVRCDVAGAEVSLNGQTVLAGTGDVRKTVRAGRQQVVARKAQHLTFTQEFVAFPDAPVIINVALVPLSAAGRSERRWATWKPWTVLAAGAAVVAIGVGYQLAAGSNIDEYEQSIAQQCPAGCKQGDLSPAVRELESRGKLQNGIAIAAFAVGGAAVAAGAVLLILNQPRRVEVDESGARVALTPWVTPSGAGAVWATTF